MEEQNNRIVKFSFVYALSAFFAILFLYLVKAQTDLIKIGYYGNADSFLALLPMFFTPLFLYLLILFLKKEKNALIILFSLFLSAMMIFRLAALVNNLMQKSDSTRGNNTFDYLIFVGLIIAFALVLAGFILTAVSTEKAVSKGTAFLKIGAKIGIVLSSILCVLFAVAIFAMTDADYKRISAVFAVSQLFDVISFIFITAISRMINKQYLQQ